MTEESSHNLNFQSGMYRFFCPYDTSNQQVYFLQECCNPGTNSVTRPATLKYLSVYQVLPPLQASGQVRGFFCLPSCGADYLQLYGVWAI